MKTSTNRFRMRKLWVAILPMLLIGVGAAQASGLLRLEDLGIFRSTTQTKKSAGPARLKSSSYSTAATQVSDKSLAEDKSRPASNHITIVDMIAESETIVRGSIESVTDGIENNFPYTEVKLRVGETLKGEKSGELTFRQFGLIRPRLMPNGYVNLNVTPQGWATYKADEQVLLFLYKKASLTGLQAPVGLAQGKFEIGSANAINQTGNIGLFENVGLDKSVLNEKNARLLATKKGPVNTDSLVSFVRSAVQNRWIEGGKLKNAR
jgi:hypothetical protein